MTSRPIPLKAHEIRSILDGSMTQMRRVCNPQPIRVDGGVPSRALPPSLIGIADPVYGIAYNCPYGKQRDQLWVRETWQTHPEFDLTPPRNIPSGSTVLYWSHYDPRVNWVSKKRPSRFMPRWASRITLEITGVRVERLQDISEADAIAEGIFKGPDYYAPPVPEKVKNYYDKLAQRGYRKLWESINGAGSWDLNPWVWVIEFKRITQPI